jgi:hypothetical protein
MSSIAQEWTESDHAIREYPTDGDCLTLDDIYQNWTYVEDGPLRVSNPELHKNYTHKVFRVYFIEPDNLFESYGNILVNIHVDETLETCIAHMYTTSKKTPLQWDTKETNRSPRNLVQWMALVEFFLGTTFMHYEQTSMSKQNMNSIHVIMQQKEAEKLKVVPTNNHSPTTPRLLRKGSVKRIFT